MNLTAITALIGKEREDDIDGLIEELPDIEADEQGYTSYMVFDIKRKSIYFEPGEPVRADTAKRFLYLGNNSGKNPQYYLTRDAESLKYLLTCTMSDLYIQLGQYSMQSGGLACIIKAMEVSGLVVLNNKKGEGSINYKAIALHMP